MRECLPQKVRLLLSLPPRDLARLEQPALQIGRQIAKPLPPEQPFTLALSIDCRLQSGHRRQEVRIGIDPDRSND